MCAGAAAQRAENKRIGNQWKHQMQAREREHMQKIAEYQMSVVQHKRVLQNANAGLNASYSRAQQQLRREEDAIWQENEAKLIQHMQKSTYGDLAASGRTGRSVARIGTMEVAALGRFYADQNSKLTDAFTDFRAGQSSAKAKAGSMMEQSFANVAFAPIADVKPPDPVFGSVGAAFAGDAMNFIGTAASVAGAFK